jgi:hypothetical protein
MRLQRGMSLAERQEMREQIRQRAFADAERKAAESGLTLRCQRASEGRDDHAICKGESPPAGGGCLCTCHDNPGVTVEVIRQEARVP